MDNIATDEIENCFSWCSIQSTFQVAWSLPHKKINSIKQICRASYND